MAWRSPPSSNPVSPILGPGSTTPRFPPSKIPALSLNPTPEMSNPSLIAVSSSISTQPLMLVIPTIQTSKYARPSEPFPKAGRAHVNRLKHGHRPSHAHGAGSIDVVPPPVGGVVPESWVSPLGKFDIEQEAVELEGYQMYAVEKWVVERSKFMKVVVVYTGDTQDVITVTVITPSTHLTNEQAQEEYDNASKELRRDGARPRETPLGRIMITSLANFRSDLNIVKIPKGNFLDERDTLYVNINLLRLGCSGRTALTLETASEAVQERFRQLYSIPAIAVHLLTFEVAVLEFIRLVQSALVIFDLFDATYDRDGLLCDTMVDSVQRWTLEIGEKLPELHLEPADRVLDPPVVAGILSVVASMRSKLLAILPTSPAPHVPRDPFQHPKAFTEALATVSPSRQGVSPMASAPPQRAFLNAQLVKSINGQYKSKVVEVKSYRLPLPNLPNTLVNNLRLPTDPFSGPTALVGGSKSATETIAQETSDLIAFSKSTSVISKDPIESLALVWTGKRGRQLMAAKQAEESWERRRVEEKDANENKSDAKSGEDEEGLLGKGISAIRQRGHEFSARLTNLPSLPGAGRKKPSMDITSLFPPSLSSTRVSPMASPDIGGPRRTLDGDNTPSPFIPEDQRALSADEGLRRPHRPFISNFGMHSALSTSNFSMSFTSTPTETTAPARPKTKSLDLKASKRSYSRKALAAANRALPPSSLPPEMESDDDCMAHRMRKSRRHPTNLVKRGYRSIYLHDTLKRRQSLSDLDHWNDVPLMTTDQMRTDVHFASALMEVGRRKRRLRLATDALQGLVRPLMVAQEIIKLGLEQQQPARTKLDNRIHNILPEVEDLAALRNLNLRMRKLTSHPLPRDPPFKSNAITAAETLKSSKYKASSETVRISNLKSDVRRHRDQYWQQRRLAYLPPETKKDEEELALSLGSKCPFLWSLQFTYKLMLLVVLWAGMLRRGEIQPTADDGWRRSTVFGTRLDRKGRTQADLDMIDREEEEDRQLEWVIKQIPISAQSFAPL